VSLCCRLLNLAGCLDSHPARCRAYASFKDRSSIRSHRRPSLCCSCRCDRFTIRLTALFPSQPSQRQHASWVPTIFAYDLQPGVASSPVNQRPLARACDVFAPACLAAAFLLASSHIPSPPITPHPPSSLPMLLRRLNHLAGKQNILLYDIISSPTTHPTHPRCDSLP